MRFLATFAVAFVSGAVVAFPILPFGLESSLAIPVALVCGTLASGLGAWLAGGRHGRLAAVLAASLASLVVLAVPLGALLFFVARTNLSISVPIVFFVVAATSAFAVRRRRGFRGPGGPAEGRAGHAKIIAAVAGLAVLVVLVVPAGQLGYDWLTACSGEERAVFEEFPQYSPRTPQELHPRPDLNAFTAAGGDCFVVYSTPDVASEITKYFEEHLREKGWERAAGAGGPLYVRRGNYEYRVTFPNAPGASERGTRVAVSVGEL